MHELKISLGLIKQNEAYLLQRRRADPKLGAAGLIGAFGGKIEPGESSRAVAAREVGEETSLQLSLHDFKYLGKVEVLSDRNLEEVKIIAQVYQTIIANTFEVIAREGELVSMTLTEVHQNISELTSATKALFKELIGEEK